MRVGHQCAAVTAAAADTDAAAAPKTLSFIRVVKLICDCNKKSYHVVIFNNGIPPKLNSECMTSVCHAVLSVQVFISFR